MLAIIVLAITVGTLITAALAGLAGSDESRL
jgi:hypothetical protein